MGKFVTFTALVAAVTLGWFWHRHRAQTSAMNTGEVYVREQPSAPVKPLPPEPAAPSRAAVDLDNAIASAAAPKPAAPAATAPHAAAAVAVSASAPARISALPSSDSLPRNPPNGLAFGGSGKFQLYRQGDITWRLDTQTGDVCVLFATDAEWRVPRVYETGCGTRGTTSVTSGD